VLDSVVEDAIAQHAPDVVVTYPVHGISGHPDHLVTHAVVKRVVCQRRAEGHAHPARLAFFTLLPPGDDEDRPDHLRHSAAEDVDGVVPFGEAALAQGHAALDCYRTYQSVVEAHRPLDAVQSGVPFELFGETPDARLTDLADALDPTALPPASPSVAAASGTLRRGGAAS
jgi:LmbE family N-acetylglucosaminyl deacetylase